MPIEITIDGTTRTVTKLDLLDLAAKGIIGPETTIQVNGKFWKAGQIKGIVFGNNVDDTLDLPEEVAIPPARNDTTISKNSGVTSQVGERCRNLGCSFTIGGFILGFLAGFFILGMFGNTSADTPIGQILLGIFYIMMGIGGFMLTAGPILLVVGWVIPDSPISAEESEKLITPAYYSCFTEEEDKKIRQRAIRCMLVMFLIIFIVLGIALLLS